ncbi:unnamed protein product [Plutella xylostella]|uniref:(diamondback moth) hypothetical protein n=1 Tax=Plutella xylostella TaxID=51655 RepID=A0A8S4EV43_PLUXY|nr:unnamed protein product [Plutella xylostella]
MEEKAEEVGPTDSVSDSHYIGENYYGDSSDSPMSSPRFKYNRRSQRHVKHSRKIDYILQKIESLSRQINPPTVEDQPEGLEYTIDHQAGDLTSLYEAAAQSVDMCSDVNIMDVTPVETTPVAMVETQPSASCVNQNIFSATTPNLQSKVPTIKPVIPEELELVNCLQRFEMAEQIKLMILDKILKPADSSASFVSPMFLVPKSDGSQRPILNLKNLNNYIQPMKFRLISHYNVPNFLQPGDWVAKAQILPGCLNFACFVIPLGRLHCRLIQIHCRDLWRSPKSKMTIPQEVLQELEWWELAVRKATPIQNPPITDFLVTDAASYGWGSYAISNNTTMAGVWDHHHTSWHSNQKELHAIYKAVTLVVDTIGQPNSIILSKKPGGYQMGKDLLVAEFEVPSTSRSNQNRESQGNPSRHSHDEASREDRQYNFGGLVGTGWEGLLKGWSAKELTS